MRGRLCCKIARRMLARSTLILLGALACVDAFSVPYGISPYCAGFGLLARDPSSGLRQPVVLRTPVRSGAAMMAKVSRAGL